MLFKDKKISLIFYLLPLIIAPFFLNLGISILFLIILFYLIVNYREINFKELYKDKFFKILIIFLIFINLNSILSYFIFEKISFNLFLKTILYNKILFLFIFQYYLIKKITIITIEKTLKISLFFTLFLLIDLIYQKIYGIDIFGHEIFYRRLSGPYGEELIPGFVLLVSGSLGFIYFCRKFFYRKYQIIYNLFIILFFYVIFLTGERMVFILSLGFLLSLLILDNEYRLKNLFNIFIILLVCFITIIFDKNLNKKYKRFFLQLGLEDKINEKIFTSDSIGIEKANNPNLFLHFTHFKSGIETWKKSPFFGSGFGNFRNVCSKNTKISEVGRCNTHPHNIYIELLSEQGLVGFIIFLTLIFYFLIILSGHILKKLFKKKTKLSLQDFFLILLFSLALIQIWPIKSSGRLFSYFNGTIFWVNIFMCYIYCLNIKQFKKK